MAAIEKISIALPAEMVAAVRQAVETGEFASSSEAIRDALRDWEQKRSLRQQGLAQMRALWLDALRNPASGADARAVLARLERKYQAIASGNAPQ